MLQEPDKHDQQIITYIEDSIDFKIEKVKDVQNGYEILESIREYYAKDIEINNIVDDIFDIISGGEDDSEDYIGDG